MYRRESEKKGRKREREGSPTETTIQNHVTGEALTRSHHRRNALALVAVSTRANGAAGSAVLGVAMEGDARVAALVVLANALAALAIHERGAFQATGTAVVVVGPGVQGAVAVAVTADVAVPTYVAAAAAVIIVGVVVDEALTVAVVVVGAGANADTPACVLSVGSRDAGIVVIGFPERDPTSWPGHYHRVECGRHVAPGPLKRMRIPRIIARTRVQHTTEEIGIALLPVRTGAVVYDHSKSGKQRDRQGKG